MSKVKSAALIVFQVLPGGTLKLRGYENPPTRDEAFALSRSFFENAESLASEADDLQPLMWELQQQYYNYHRKKLDEIKADDEINAYQEKWPENADEELARNWVTQLSGKEFEKLRTQIKEWTQAEPDRLREIDYFRVPADGQEAAMEFFEYEGFDVSEEVGVEIVEGSHPGSSYYAAELRLYSVGEANDRAAAAGMDIRFEAEDG